MPKRSDIATIMIIGSGPIVIGQAAEFDYSGTQACASIREEGYRVVLVNSNPATIQTDLETADAVYIEPITADIVAKIIEKERPDGILSGMGGQTGLNICSELADNGTLEKYGVELLGTPLEAIRRSEDRDYFRKTMDDIGEPVPESIAASSVDECKRIAEQLGYPVIVRAAYTLGGLGSGIAYTEQELEKIAGAGIAYSRIKQVLIEECVVGWQEFEYEVMRDSNNNCITICNMENVDAMGVHTGESIVVAPAQTLSDATHQMLRSAALTIIRSLDIQGGCNVQFAVNRETAEYRVIEVNPRVSRSSALASKATGYPIARVAAKIAVGLTLDEITNKVTSQTKASFEPALDYIVTKIPRWPFDKFSMADKHIGTSMKSTGEVMAIGRTFEESVHKAVRSLEVKKCGFEPLGLDKKGLDEELAKPTDRRIFAVVDALRAGYGAKKIAAMTGYDLFFIHKLKNIADMEATLTSIRDIGAFDEALFTAVKRLGFSDARLAQLTGIAEDAIRAARLECGIGPTYKMVDTCAAEFEARTPYYYSSYESTCEAVPTERESVAIIGAGPIRIGQGIEFDCCCVHAVEALRESDVEAIMLNNNPETVSTDFDISDRLYFEPLTLEDVIAVIENEKPRGVIVQFGGQTSVNLAVPLERYLKASQSATKILGTSSDSIDIAEDRERFEALLNTLEIARPQGGTGYSFGDVRAIANDIGYPVLVRPSYVLGGRAMEIVGTEKELEFYMKNAAAISDGKPILVDKFLTDAIEVDVDAVCDGTEVFIAGILEHIEEAGVHSGDAAMVMPPQTLTAETIETLKDYTKKLALALKTVGLINIQYAVKDNVVYVIEANPRASRTVPFISKAIGVQIAKVATKIMLGAKLGDFGLGEYRETAHICVKESVFPFIKLPGVDTILGPEMKSTGEVMGVDVDFDTAYYKAQIAAGNTLPSRGTVFLTIGDDDKKGALPVAAGLQELGFRMYATKGTHEFLKVHGIETDIVWKIGEEFTPDALDLMRSGKVNLIINTPQQAPDQEEEKAMSDGYMMRRLAVDLQIPYITTIAAARAAVGAIRKTRDGGVGVRALNEYFGSRV